MESLDKKDNRATYLLILAFILLAAGIITTGYLSYRNYANHYRVEVEHQLSAIADLKVGELAHWRKERLGDAAAFYGNEAFSSLVRRYFNHPNDLRTQRQIWTWLSKIQLVYSYERLFLFDARGALRMSVPDSKEPVASNLLQRAAIVMRSEQIDFQDFYRDEQNQRIYLTLMIPILSKEIGSQTLGVLVLRIDPETYLYPLIRYWPTPSQTAETLLVRREGNEAVFLNDLRFQQDAALKLRVPQEKVELPAVKATLGQEGIVEGKDYRGVPVIAAIRSIPDSPWFLAARMDLSEAYGPLKERLWLMIILVVALLIGIGTGIGLVWRQQHIRFYRERHEADAALRESEEKYRSIFDNAPLGILHFNEKGIIMSCNDKLVEIIGSSREVLVGMNMLNLPDKHIVEAVKLALNGKQGYYDDEYRSITANKVTPLHTLFTPIVSEKGEVIGGVGIIEDITDRKQAEEALQESEERYRTLVHNASDIVFRLDDAGYLTFVNPAALRVMGYGEKELIGKHYATLIRPDRRDEAMKFFGHQFVKKIENTYSEYPVVVKDGHEIWLGQNTQLILQDGKVVAFQAMCRDITEMKQAEEKIQQMAYHDSLTGLPNRKLFSDRLGIALAQAQRNQKGVAVTMLDLDHFKDVNDTLGHNVGDLLLKAAAERLSAALRKGDTVARFGGDEFVLILPDLKGIEDVIQVAQKIVESFRQPFLIDTHQLIVTTSIGIAVYPHDGTDGDSLLKNADIAMYQVKQTGRDRYQLC